VRYRILKVFGVTTGAACSAYIAAAGYLYLFQRSYVFHPDATIVAPAERALEGVESATIEAQDGTRLAGWYNAAEPGRPTVLYFHGNAGTIAGRADRFRQILASGFGLLAMNYRGYGGSAGSPSEAALFSDGVEIFDWLAERSGTIVVHGESLGTAVATYVAAERPAAALILEAPFTAALDIAAATYPWVPVRLLMRDPLLSREHIRRVEEPVLIVHGTADAVVPVDYGERIYEAAGEPKEIAIVDGAGHSDLWERGLWAIALGFLERNGAPAQAAP